MELPAIEQHLRTAVTAHAAGDTDAIGAGLKVLSTGENVVRLLSALWSDPRRLAVAASQSYLHANGFLKIALLSGDGFKLRLHLWMPQETGVAQDIEDIHNHRWDFASHMLAGAYRYQEFTPAADGTPYFGYTYRSPENDSIYPLQGRGTELLRCVFDATLQAHTSYTLRAEVLHRVTGDPDRLTATLMLQGAVRRPATDVYTTSNLGHFVAVPVERLSPDGLGYHLRAFAHYLTDH